MIGRVEKNTPAAQPQPTPSASPAVQQQKATVNKYMASKGRQLLGAGEPPVFSKNTPHTSQAVAQAAKPHLRSKL